METMAVKSRRRRIVVFVCLALATVVLAGIAIDQALGHNAATCQGLNCPSGGGASGGGSTGSGNNTLLYISAVAACLGALATVLQALAAFRKNPLVQLVPAVAAGPAGAPSPAVQAVQAQPVAHAQPVAQAEPWFKAQPTTQAQPGPQAQPGAASNAPKGEIPWWQHPGPNSS